MEDTKKRRSSLHSLFGSMDDPIENPMPANKEGFDEFDGKPKLPSVDHHVKHVSIDIPEPFPFRQSSRQSPRDFKQKKSFIGNVNETAEDDNLPRAFVKKGLLSIKELNKQFMEANLYFAIIIVLLYFGLGVLVYEYMCDTWTRLDSFYFVICTIFTIGYGDYVPSSPSQRVFTSFYILVGIAICGTFLGTLSTYYREQYERTRKQRNVRALMDMTEDRSLSTSSHGSTAGKRALDVLTSLMTPTHQSQSSSHGSNQVELATANITNPMHEKNEKSNSAGDRRKSRRSSMILDFAYNFSYSKPQKTLEELREAAVSAHQHELDQIWGSALRDFMVIFGLLVFGMVSMKYIEDWTLADSFYWATITIMTVGYGDFAPTSASGKIFTIFYVVFGCIYMAKALTDFMKYPLLYQFLSNEIKVINQFTERHIKHEVLHDIYHNELYKLIPDLHRHSNEMSKCEFVLMVLQMMDKVEEKDIYLISRLFDNLDKEHKGYLSNRNMNDTINEAKAKDDEIAALERQRSANTTPNPSEGPKRRMSGSMFFPILSRGNSFRNPAGSISEPKNNLNNISNVNNNNVNNTNHNLQSPLLKASFGQNRDIYMNDNNNYNNNNDAEIRIHEEYRPPSGFDV